MKTMKTMKTMVAMLAVLAATASCQKDPAGQGNGIPREVDGIRVSVSYPKSANVRSVGDKVVGESPMMMVTGDLFFTNEAGLIIRHIGVGNSRGSDNFDVAEISGGEGVIRNMTTEAVKCHILANYNLHTESTETALDNNMEGKNISVVLAKTMTLNDINDANGSVNNLPLYGVGDVVFVDSNGDPISGTSASGLKYGGRVDVVVNSLATRLQLGKLTAVAWFQNLSGTQGNSYYDKTHENGDGTFGAWLDINGGAITGITRTVEIVDFEVEGIYINFFHGKEALDPSVSYTGEPSNGLQLHENYLKTTPRYVPANGGYAVLDNFAAPDNAASGTPLALLPDADAPTKVWAYNLLAGTPPHIVIRFSKVVIKDSQKQAPDEDPSDPADDVLEEITAVASPDAPMFLYKPYYITVKGFLDSTSASVTSFAVNNLYTLGDLQFDYTDLTEQPEDNSLNVLVNVEMMKWVDNPITWDKD
jgi:hypothetical protein